MTQTTDLRTQEPRTSVTLPPALSLAATKPDHACIHSSRSDDDNSFDSVFSSEHLKGDEHDLKYIIV